jgi:hypothetical protein
MKKIVFFLLLIAASTQLKAQQLLQARPNIKLNDGLQNAFKPATGLTPQQMLTPPTQTANNETIFYSTMPILKASSVDHMPILLPGKDGVNYTMLVKKEKVINPAEQPSTQPLP